MTSYLTNITFKRPYYVPSGFVMQLPVKFVDHAVGIASRHGYDGMTPTNTWYLVLGTRCVIACVDAILIRQNTCAAFVYGLNFGFPF